MSKYLTPSRHYIRIPNELIADRTLPEMVRVLYCIMAYLLSIPGFVITIGALRKYTGKSAATISAALSVLRKHGYLRQYRSCCSGKWVWAYVLFSEPQNDGLNAIQQTRQLPSSKYVAPKSGYTKVSGSFIRRKDIHPTSKMVYLFLAAHAGKPGFSLHTWAIAEVLGHSEADDSTPHPEAERTGLCQRNPDQRLKWADGSDGIHHLFFVREWFRRGCFHRGCICRGCIGSGI